MSLTIHDCDFRFLVVTFQHWYRHLQEEYNCAFCLLIWGLRVSDSMAWALVDVGAAVH